VENRKVTFVLCFVFDCRGNPLRNAKVTFHLAIDGRRVSLGEVPTSGIRARPASVMINHPPGSHPYVEVEVVYGRLRSEALHLDAVENRFCEVVFHIDDLEQDWGARKRRRGWRCRHAERHTIIRSV
jgi:hypothetical protein